MLAAHAAASAGCCTLMEAKPSTMSCVLLLVLRRTLDVL
jgi:hypothetical protein